MSTEINIIVVIEPYKLLTATLLFHCRCFWPPTVRFNISLRTTKIKKISDGCKCREFLKKTIRTIRKKGKKNNRTLRTDNPLEATVVRHKCDEQNFIDR